MDSIEAPPGYQKFSQTRIALLGSLGVQTRPIEMHDNQHHVGTVWPITWEENEWRIKIEEIWPHQAKTFIVYKV
jgi:hypothetical protein